MAEHPAGGESGVSGLGVSGFMAFLQEFGFYISVL